jgi:drug/metabolite transporter (DMT)-like permease
MNFIYCVPMVSVASLLFISDFDLTSKGFALAMASGALASACGYAIWYTVLPHLKTTHAATVQLSVPALAAIGGVVLLSEEPSVRLVLASVATLGGVAIVLKQRSKA